MPRPRILGSPRVKSQNVDKFEVRKKGPQVVTIGDDEEPDCEIIKIQDDDEEEDTEVRVEVHRVANMKCAVPQGLPSMQLLHLLPSTSTNMPNSGQNLVMVGSFGNQILSPTLYTLQQVVNPTEISKIQQVVGTKQNKRSTGQNIVQPDTSAKQIKETRKKILQAVFRHNSDNLKAENLRLINENRVKGVREETETSAGTNNEDNAPNTSDFTSVESSFEVKNWSTEIDESFENVLKNLKSHSKENNALIHQKGRFETEELAAKSSFVKNPKHAISDSKNPRKSEIASDDANLLENSKSSTSLVKNPKAVGSIGNQSHTNFVNKNRKGGENPSKLRENLSPAFASSSKIVDEGHSSKATTSLAKNPKAVGSIANQSHTNFVNKNQKDGENPSKLCENLSPAIASSSKIVGEGHSSKGKNENNDLCKVQCIVCKKSFSNRTELHRHASLVHPEMQLLFCDMCSDSFLVHDELQSHRADCHDDVTEIVEMIEIEEETNCALSKSQKKGISRRFRAQMLKEENQRRAAFARSNILPARRRSSVVKIRRKRGRPFKNPFKKSEHVEEEVLNRVAGEKRKSLGCAKIRKLVVKLARLEDQELEKYLEKRKKSPITRFRDEDESSENRRKKRRWRRNYNHVGNLSKRSPKPTRKMMEYKNMLQRTKSAVGKKKKIAREDPKSDKSLSFRMDQEKNESDDDSAMKFATVARKLKLSPSEIDKIVGTEKVDTGRNEMQVIRKLTSRSSAASVFTLRMDNNNRAQPGKRKSTEDWKSRFKETVSCSKNTEKSSRYAKEEATQISIEESKLSDDSTLEEFDPEQFEEDSRQNEMDNVEDEENRHRIEVDFIPEKAASSKKSGSLKTYLPSKRKASKENEKTFDVNTYVLCVMCTELFALMKQLSDQFIGTKANKISVKCPLCSLYFMSMFWLKEHISNSHLFCKNKHCKLTSTAMIAKSVNDSAFNCETKVELAWECQHCAAKFSEENDLVDHVFTQHDAFISDNDKNTYSLYYLDDLPSSCLKTCSINHVESPSKRLKADESPPDKPDTYAAKSTNDSLEIVKDSTENLSLSCILCDMNFTGHTDYFSHIRIVHMMSPSSSVFQPCRLAEAPNNSCAANLHLPRSEAEGCRNKGTSEPSEIEITYQRMEDREYLLKQLLSDDSADGFNDTETAKSPANRKQIFSKVSAKPKEELPTKKCHICFMEFKRTQDLLIHSLEHDSNASESAANDPPIEINEGVSNWLDYDWNARGLVDSAAPAPPAEESSTKTKSMDEDNIKDDIFGSADEINDFSLAYESKEAEIFESKKKTASSPVESSSKRRKVENRSACESTNKKQSALDELLETEEGLANPKETNGKLPIKCSKCNRQFPNQSSLNEHLFFLHDDNLKDTVLTDVLSSRLNDEKTVPLSQEWRCEKCSQNFKYLQRYGRHRYFVHGDDEMVHVCENCCKVMTTVTMVNVHICTDVASYNCRTCNETFATGMTLRLHNMYKHKETEGPHLCAPCNKKFLTDAMLKRHQKWKHRFLRPFKPRKSSPVIMATPKKVSGGLENVDTEMDSGCDQEYVDMESEFAGREDSQSCKLVPKTRKRGRPRSTAKNPSQTKPPQEKASRPNRTVTLIDENEILQCNLCRLYCLSLDALRAHKVNSHSIMDEVCLVCGKTYPKGKLIRHITDQHINPCETYTGDKESIWNMGTNVEEKDAEELIGMLGMNRFISLCEYQRFSESPQDGAVTCPTCDKDLPNSEDYKYHFLMNHDTMCALCNIEFKSGNKAAIHKTEDHGSIDSYVWFADQTVTALTAATNFSEVAEKSFIEMISHESDKSSNESNDEWTDVDEELLSGEKISRGNDERAEADNALILPADLAETDDKKLMVVVTDEDLRKYGIGTDKPNIWGLASKISSTSRDHTPKDVKAMLETYFGR